MKRALDAALCVALAITVAAASDITLKDVTVSLLEGSGTEVTSMSLVGPSTGDVGALDHTRTLKVSLTTELATRVGQTAPGADFRPQQVFVRLTSCASKDAAYFAVVKAKDGTLYATAKSADIQKQIGPQGGSYNVDLLVGDTRVDQPLLWSLGKVQVLHPPLDDGSQPVAAPYRAMDRLFKPLPEILHMHRAPERRAPAVISLFFTLLAVSPLGLYVVLALQMGANLKGFPCSAGFLAAAGFHLGLLSILALYLLFWIRLNLMQTLPALVVLSAVTAVFGSSTLNQLSAVRQKQE